MKNFTYRSLGLIVSRYFEVIQSIPCADAPSLLPDILFKSTLLQQLAVDTAIALKLV